MEKILEALFPFPACFCQRLGHDYPEKDQAFFSGLEGSSEKNAQNLCRQNSLAANP
jgi:hypothetical protein